MIKRPPLPRLPCEKIKPIPGLDSTPAPAAKRVCYVKPSVTFCAYACPYRHPPRKPLQEILLPWGIALCYVALVGFFWWLDHGQ
jgi:hypothetical protein